MTLAEWLARIERLHPTEIEMGLERIGAVARRLGLLPLAAPAVVVAGTNGKGSTVTLIDALARAGGMRTVRYSSPHILCFNERVRCNGRPATDAELVAAFDAVEAARQGISLTYFEFSTLAALYWFAGQKPDLYILEVGLGGRLDAVNLVDADVAVMTSLGLDHTDWLGDTIEQIAFEKAGIRRAGKPLVCGAQNLPESIAERCAADGVELLRSGDQFGMADQLYWQKASGEQGAIGLLGPVPLGADNLACAVQALACLERLPDAAIPLVAQQTSAPGRAQALLINGVQWILDVGHNAEALERFAAQVPSAEGERRVLVAMLADKPARQALKAFESMRPRWYLAGLEGARGQSAQQLREALSNGEVASCFPSVAQAVECIREDSTSGDQVLVFGSFHTVAQAAMALGIDLE